MRLASLPGPVPGGRLVVVSRDLRRMASADDIASGMLDAIRRWDDVIGQLRERFEQVESGQGDRIEPFDPRVALAPLPRAPQWLDGSVFQNHLDLMSQVVDPDRPFEPSGFPLIYQGASDDLRGPTDPISGYRFDEDIDFEGELGVIVDDVPMRTTAADALEHVRLLVLINDVSLRAYAPREVASGFGFLNAKPSTAFGPVAVTPDELGDAWRDGRIHLPLRVERSGEWFGHPSGSEMTFHFGELIAHAARTRRLSAGTIVGSGTVSNADRSTGSACISERRAIEIIDTGAASTGFLRHGETVRMEVLDEAGRSVFGAIDQSVAVAP